MNWPFWCVLGWVLFGVAMWGYRDVLGDFWRMVENCEKIEAMLRRAWDREEQLRELVKKQDDEGEDYKHGRN